jgi:4-amino-4-deoxychorismate lyase
MVRPCYASPTGPDTLAATGPRQLAGLGSATVKQRVVGVLGSGVLDPDATVLHADDVGLTRGDGCFEATRVLTGPDGHQRIDHLEEHLDRFDRSCAGLDLAPIDRAAWHELIEELLACWALPGEAMLRLMLSRGRESDPTGPVTGIATLTELAEETLRQRRDGIAVITLERGLESTAFGEAPWLLGGIKTLSYAINLAGTREALRRGADDVIFTSSDGYLLEAPTSTVVWLHGDQLRTTRLDGTGVLASITQRALFEAAEGAGFETAYALGTVAELRACDGVWLVSSGRGVAQLHTLDGTPLAAAGELTAQLRKLAGF